MTKVYRIWEHTSYGTKELAFLSSFKAACNYIMAQLKDAEEIAGYSRETGRWIHITNDKKLFAASLKEGYHWGKMSGAYMLTSYWVEIIPLED